MCRYCAQQVGLDENSDAAAGAADAADAADAAVCCLLSFCLLLILYSLWSWLYHTLCSSTVVMRFFISFLLCSLIGTLSSCLKTLRTSFCLGKDSGDSVVNRVCLCILVSHSHLTCTSCKCTMYLQIYLKYIMYTLHTYWHLLLTISIHSVQESIKLILMHVCWQPWCAYARTCSPELCVQDSTALK